MADRIEILSLDIDTQALISKMTQTRDEIERLKASQKSLSNSNQTNSDSFTKNAVEIARLQTSYTAQSNVVKQLTVANNGFATATAAITSALSVENTSIATARENNTKLLALRNQLNLSTTDGQAALTQINGKLDQNNAFIKENVSAYEQQKIGIGDYRSAITGAIADSGLFGGSIQSVKQSVASFTPLLTTMKGEVQAGAAQIRNSATATEGMTVAQKALSIATGIGTGAMRIFTVALAATGIGLIIAAVALLIGYFKTFTPIIDKVEQGMAAFGAVVKVVQQALIKLLTLDFSGFDGLTGKLKDAAGAAIDLKKAQQDLDDANQQQELSSARNRAEINKLSIQAKDRTKSEEERLALLKRASDLEDSDFQARKVNSDEATRIALQQIKNEAKLTDSEFAELQKRGLNYKEFVEKRTNNTDELFDALDKALLAQTANENEFYTNQEKNINKQNKLIEDAAAEKEKQQKAAADAAQKRADAAAKAIDNAIQKNKEEIDLYVEQQGIKAKSLDDELKFQEELLNRKLALVKKEYDAKKISETAFQTESLKLKNDFAKLQADATVTNALRELEIFNQNNKTLLDGKKFLNEEILASEIDRLNKTSEAEATAATAKLVAGTITTEQYNDAIKSIDDKFATDKAAAELAKSEADKAKKALDLENKLATDQLTSENEFAFRAAEIERNQAQEIEAALKNGADVGLINEKYAAQKKALDKSVADFKLSQELQLLQGIKGLFGENSKIGKAAALAEIGLTTYSNAFKAFAQAAVFAADPLTLPLAANANIQGGLIIAGGAAQAAKVAGIKFADGGQVPTLGSGLIDNGSNLSIPLSNGDDTLAYVGQGEVILNERQQALAGGNMFFKSIGVPGFAGGGLISGNNNLGSQGGQKIDIELMANLIAQANSNLPSPIVSVQDINYTQQSVRVVEAGANF